MAQVLKAEVKARILEAAGAALATQGYSKTSMAKIARDAKVATANVYRYFADKAALFDAVVPASVVAEHDALLDERLDSLGGPSEQEGAAAGHLLDFWIQHRWAVIILLDHASETPYSDYPQRFVRRLITQGERTLGRPLSHTQSRVVEIIFDNTRRALAEILRSSDDPTQLRALVSGFWSYQLPGLDGLSAWMKLSAE